MNDITDYILSRTSLKVEPEITLSPPGFRMFNTGSVEVEIGEFLYSFVRMCKPQLTIETGTHFGISSAYMGLALQKNANGGKLRTYEVIPSMLQHAQALWNQLEVNPYIDAHLEPSLEAQLPTRREIDLLFLDSEPQYRFDEFLRFWSRLRDGGFILIHDLHPSMGHHGQTYHGMYDWPYGDFREKLGKVLTSFNVQAIHFPTPRGFTLFQRLSPEFETVKYMKEKLLKD